MLNLEENVKELINSMIEDVFIEVLEGIEDDDAEELSAYELIERLRNTLNGGRLMRRKIKYIGTGSIR